MAICMKLSPHVCETACEKPVVRKGKNSTTVSIRLSDDQARELKELAQNYDSVGSYIKKQLILKQALRKR